MAVDGGTSTQWQGLAGSMRVRIITAVVLLLVIASGLSLVVLRQVLFAQLNDEIDDRLGREVEEFQRLRQGCRPPDG